VADPSAWVSAPDDTYGADEAPEGDAAPDAEVIFDPAPTSPGEGSAASDAAFTALLRSLRALPGPCAPPVGEGAFDILYASAREIVVWFVPAKDGVEQKEVAIPARLARVAWDVLLRGEPVDEAALRAIAAGAAGGRWLLALFAQLPSIEVRNAPASDDAASEIVTLQWRGDASA
jgi:hypothetical protein